MVRSNSITSLRESLMVFLQALKRVQAHKDEEGFARGNRNLFNIGGEKEKCLAFDRSSSN